MSNTDIDINLRRDDCFTVVDPGGGTVDLVSYKVDAVNPSFRPIIINGHRRIKYGSTNIDRYFLEIFLRQRLGNQEYGKLLALGTERGGDSGGRHTTLRRGEKVMFDRFQPIKHAFMDKPRNRDSQIPHPIDLPDGIGEHNDPSHSIIDGRLVITDDDLKEMFDDAVEGTLNLIDQQITLIRSKGLNVKVVRVDDPLPAVAKGAVLMGLGVYCEKPPPNSRAPYHIGIVLAERFARYAHEEWQRYDDSLDGVSRAKDHIKWVVAKGDLVTPHEQIAKKVKIVHKITPRGKKAGRVRVILSSREETGDDINQLHRLSDIHDVTREKVHLDYDLRRIPDVGRRNCYKRINDRQTGQEYDKVEMHLEVTVSLAGDISLHLRAGATEDHYGQPNLQGYQLAYWAKPRIQ
ncbi:hypothetical protein F5X98DRAFT_376248 [Xylaria grammica]|nr:hypothetical protein F5X98DRAFT_376248 [Xylaria grammica]